MAAQGHHCTLHTWTSGQYSPHEISRTARGARPELRRLQGAFRRVLEGAVEIVLIAGYPGIGKTALFEEFRTWFPSRRQTLSGVTSISFVQLRLTPYCWKYSGKAMRQILAAEPNQTAVWRDKFRDVLEKNGALITEIIPELELITGPFEAVRTNLP